ncbi:MAG: hypothetical protein A2341_22240 [Deltaproteobacteria bacterium RIFOXYB12_FULL_58_9]|nr:MAG: hypothetical protein A2341_22240 [Deltaproteobacteria bacterium RIFOXYB12_FULL_58_9]
MRTEPQAPADAIGTGGIRFTSSFDAVTISIYSLADGQTRTCDKPLEKGMPCYVNGLPAGPATVTFKLGDEQFAREIVIRAGDLERQMQLVDGRLGATPWIVGAVVLIMWRF